jgi:hypothetical protein
MAAPSDSADTARMAAAGAVSRARLDCAEEPDVLITTHWVRHTCEEYRSEVPSAAEKPIQFVWLAGVFGRNQIWPHFRITNRGHGSIWLGIRGDDTAAIGRRYFIRANVFCKRGNLDLIENYENYRSRKKICHFDRSEDSIKRSRQFPGEYSLDSSLRSE